MDNLFANKFPGFSITIATNGDYMLAEKLEVRWWAMQVNHAAEHLCRVAILNRSRVVLAFHRPYILFCALGETNREQTGVILTASKLDMYSGSLTQLRCVIFRFPNPILHPGVILYYNMAG